MEPQFSSINKLHHRFDEIESFTDNAKLIYCKSFNDREQLLTSRLSE